MEVNMYIRSLFEGTVTDSKLKTRSKSVKVEPQPVSIEEVQQLREEFHEHVQTVGSPEEALVRGRENWAREHGY